MGSQFSPGMSARGLVRRADFYGFVGMLPILVPSLPTLAIGIWMDPGTPRAPHGADEPPESSPTRPHDRENRTTIR